MKRLDLHSQQISRLESLFDILRNLQGLDARVEIRVIDNKENIMEISVSDIVLYIDGEDRGKVAHHE